MQAASNPPQGKWEQEPPTQIVKDQMTDKQKELSKYYDKDFQRGEKYRIDDPVITNGPNAKSELRLVSPPPLEALSDVGPEPTLEDFFRGITCEADVIVEGTVRDKTSQLMYSGHYIFTEYTFDISQVYKNNAGSALTPDSSIDVIRPGGRVQINGRVITIYAASWVPLGIGNRCLLFLKYISKTDSYDSSLLRGSFLIKNESLVKLTDDDIPGFTGDTPLPFSNSIHRTISSDCSK